MKSSLNGERQERGLGGHVLWLLTSSLRLLASRTPLEPDWPPRATLPAAAAAAAAALRGFRAPGGEVARGKISWHGVQNLDRAVAKNQHRLCPYDE